MDPTDEQKAVVKYLRDTFGRDVVKARTPRAQDGKMPVDLKCQAGVWTWTYNRDGTLADAYLTGQLFDMKPQPRVTLNPLQTDE